MHGVWEEEGGTEAHSFTTSLALAIILTRYSQKEPVDMDSVDPIGIIFQSLILTI